VTAITFKTLHQRLLGPILPIAGRINQPLVVADGMGVDSTAALIELARRYKSGEKSCRPDLILFADPGSEWPETYWYLENVRQPWLKSVGFPPAIVVRYQPNRATYDNLYDNCVQNATYPGITFNRKNCSQKFKRGPQDGYCRHWQPAKSAWVCGMKCIKGIGYDAGPKDMRRPAIPEDVKYTYWYPLRELGWNRERCIEEIKKEGLSGWTKDRGGDFIEVGGIPVKSDCTFCIALQPHELDVLCRDYPELASKNVALEAAAGPYHDPSKIEGLWRTTSKKRSGSMTRYILERKLLTEKQVAVAQQVGLASVKQEVRQRRTLFALKQANDCSGYE